jgi:hypothetical protein
MVIKEALGNASFAGDRYNVVFKYLGQGSNGNGQIKYVASSILHICVFLVSFGIIKHL